MDASGKSQWTGRIFWRAMATRGEGVLQDRFDIHDCWTEQRSGRGEAGLSQNDGLAGCKFWTWEKEELILGGREHRSGVKERMTCGRTDRGVRRAWVRMKNAEGEERMGRTRWRVERVSVRRAGRPPWCSLRRCLIFALGKWEVGWKMDRRPGCQAGETAGKKWAVG